MQEKRMTIKVLIENDQIFADEYNSNQKIQVIVNKTVAHLKIETQDRELRREDGTPILDFNLTIDEVHIVAGESLRFFKKSIKPDRDKGFA